ncbi:hypothetical protein PENSPDRAFT_695027 [Peniophora sp. CONT]|nr:hypothetical protein PENSPDRAFT_695027 [Peniophora sp. CONT]
MLSDAANWILHIAYVVLYPALTVFWPLLRPIWRISKRAPIDTLLGICLFCLLWVAIGLLILSSQILGCSSLPTCDLDLPAECVLWPWLNTPDFPSTANVLNEHERLKNLEVAVGDVRHIISQHSQSSSERTSCTHALRDPMSTIFELRDTRLLHEQLSTSVDSAHHIASQHHAKVRSELGMLANEIQDAQNLLADLILPLRLELEEAEEDARKASQSLHAVEKPDFALYTTGGMTLSSHTSPALNISVASKPTGADMAIHHDINPGYCWPFSGSRGHLAVQLPRSIIIDELAVDHPRNHWDLSPAPRYMEVWALIRGPEAIRITNAWAVGGDHVPSEDVRTIFGEDRYLRIARFEYDLHSADVMQNFPVDESFAELSVPLQTVFLLITDNWGNHEYTCIYRFRVHGHLPVSIEVVEDVAFLTSDQQDK